MKENQWNFFKELILIYQFIFPLLKKKTTSFLELYIKINELLQTKWTRCL